MSGGAPCGAPTAGIETRPNEAATFLTSKSYVGNWELTAAGPLLPTNRCPCEDLASAHPDLCQTDLDLITRATRSEIKRVCQSTAMSLAPLCFCHAQLQPLHALLLN